MNPMLWVNHSVPQAHLGLSGLTDPGTIRPGPPCPKPIWDNPRQCRGIKRVTNTLSSGPVAPVFLGRSMHILCKNMFSTRCFRHCSEFLVLKTPSPRRATTLSLKLLGTLETFSKLLGGMNA